MVSKKDKKHSGWISPNLTINKKDLINNDLYLNDFYDDWEDHRDGYRDNTDKKKFQPKHIKYPQNVKQYNKKLKKKEMIRKKKKHKYNYLKT